MLKRVYIPLLAAIWLLFECSVSWLATCQPSTKQRSQLLAFFNHSPEMRAYVEWALKILDADRVVS
jgi:hypothetical protein